MRRKNGSTALLRLPHNKTAPLSERGLFSTAIVGVNGLFFHPSSRGLI